MSRVVVALDGFKGTLTAAQAADAFAAGWREERGDDELLTLPVADGGEGTVAAIERALPGAERRTVDVVGPDDLPRAAGWLRVGDVGVVELADASGIELLHGELRPETAHTRGFGAVIAAALDDGVAELWLGIGGSASTDGGAGVLTALGALLRDERGRPIAPGLAGVRAVRSVDLTRMRALPSRGVRVLSDVTHPLLGERGSAAVFGPQKGLAEADIPAADAALARFASLVGADPMEPGTGAAGGVGYALRAWGADLVPGAAAIAELIGLAGAIAGADLVVTGEGSFDAASAHGKAPGYVASLAAARGVPVALVAGRIAADASAFVDGLALGDIAGSDAAAMAEPERWMRAAGALLARRYSARRV